MCGLELGGKGFPQPGCPLIGALPVLWLPGRGTGEAVGLAMSPGQLSSRGDMPERDGRHENEVMGGKDLDFLGCPGDDPTDRCLQFRFSEQTPLLR